MAPRAKKTEAAEPETQVVAYKGWWMPDPFDALLRLFPPKVWAAVVFGDCDARPIRMDDLEGHEQILWGRKSLNITRRRAERHCTAFNSGC